MKDVNMISSFSMFGCLKDENSPVLSTGKRGQLKRANSCRVVSVIQKSSDLLDIVAIENGSKAVGNKLATSRSCLALNEIEKISNGLDKDSMSGKSIHDFVAESFLRKDSEAESGFIEAEADFENETTKIVPFDSFDSLPPLEQRRQIRIHELFELEEKFTKGFDYLARNVQASLRNISFNEKTADSLKALTGRIIKIAKLLTELSTETAQRKVVFPVLEPSQNGGDYYINSIGLLHSAKIADILGIYEDIRNRRAAAETRMGDSELREIVLLCDDAIEKLPEHFLHLQLGLKYVLYCTPRKHIDYRPLRDIIGELDHMNRSNFEKKSEDFEKERADSCPLYDKKSKSSIKRRYSWDNQALKKITNISKSFTFMKTSTRNSKAEVESSAKAETPKDRGQNTPRSLHTWHSTPKSRKSLDKTEDFYSREIRSKEQTSNGSVVNSKDQNCHETPEKYAGKRKEGSKLGTRKTSRVERSLTVDSSSLEGKMEENRRPGSRQRNNSYRISCERTSEKQTELSTISGPKMSPKERSSTIDSNSLEGKMEDNCRPGSRQRNNSYIISCERTSEKQTELSKIGGPKMGPRERSSTVDSSSFENKMEDSCNLGSRQRNNSYKISCERTDGNKATEYSSQFRNRSFAVGSKSLDYCCEDNDRRKQSFDHFCKRNECYKGSPDCVSKEVDYNCSTLESKRDINSMGSDHCDIKHKESFDCSSCDEKLSDTNHRGSFDLTRKSRHSCGNRKPIGNDNIKLNCNERITGEVCDEKMAGVCPDCLYNQNNEKARRSGKHTEKYSVSRGNQDENSGINSDELRSGNLMSIPDASPRILRNTIPESSPSLIRNNFDYFSYSSDCDTTPRIEVGSSNVETRTRSSIDSIYDNDINIDDVNLDFLGVPTIVGSLDSYTSDEDSQLDRLISKMVKGSAARSSSRGLESDSRGQDHKTAQLNKNKVNKQNDFIYSNGRLENQKSTSNQLTPSQNGVENKQNRPGGAGNILVGKGPHQEQNGITERNPRREQKSKFRSKSPKLSVPNFPSFTPVDDRKLSLPEDSRKGIKLSVARAKKKLLDFTSPRISRKKEKYFQSFDDSEIYAEDKSIDKASLHGDRAKNCPYPIYMSSPCKRKERNFGSSDSSCCDSRGSQGLSQNGNTQSLIEDVNDSPTGRINLDMFSRRNQEKDRLSSTSSGWSDLGQSNLAFDRKVSNSESISAIANKSHSSQNASASKPRNIGCASFDELSETTERARSPSIVSNLSISSHFNLTVKRFLETSELGVTRVGNSVFYCDSTPVKSAEVENSGEITPLKSDSVTRLAADSKQIAENEVLPANGYVPSEVEQPLVVNSVSTSETSKTEGCKFIIGDKVSTNLGNPTVNAADAAKQPMCTKAAIGLMAVSAAMGHVGVDAAKGQMATSAVNMHMAKDIANMVLPIAISKTELGLQSSGQYSKPHHSCNMDPQKVLEKGRRVSKNRIVSWGENLDSLLTDKDGVKIFQVFLKSEYSEENLLFWLACESFKSVRSTKINREAIKIVKTFIENFSSNEVNLDHDTRMKITQTMSSPCKNMFNQAQTRIKQLMAQDSYPRFIRSSMYQNLLYPNRSQAS